MTAPQLSSTLFSSDLELLKAFDALQEAICDPDDYALLAACEVYIALTSQRGYVTPTITALRASLYRHIREELTSPHRQSTESKIEDSNETVLATSQKDALIV